MCDRTTQIAAYTLPAALFMVLLTVRTGSDARLLLLLLLPPTAAVALVARLLLHGTFCFVSASTPARAAVIDSTDHL